MYMLHKLAHETFSYRAVLENNHTLPMEGFFASPLPPGNSSLASYFASKILALKTPLPLGISTDLPWGGYGFFSGTAHCGDLMSQLCNPLHYSVGNCSSVHSVLL